MPRKARELGALEVKRLAHPGRGGNVFHPVGGVDGLMMQITPKGSRSWVLRVTVGTRRRKIGLGSYPEISVAKAREAAREAREAIRAGRDPIEERKAARAALAAQQSRGLTFRDSLDRFLAAKSAQFENPKRRKQWRSTLESYAVPVIGRMMLLDVTVHDVARVLSPVWTAKPETARKLRGWLEGIFAWATVAGHRDGENPARWKGNLDALLPRQGKGEKHFPAVALTDAPDWFADLRGREGMATRALEFLALTAARSGEVRGATWAEVDLEGALWTIPAARMKAGREHRVPLPAEAVALLRGLDRRGELVFPAVRGGMLSDMALSSCMRRVNDAREGGYLDPRSGRPAVPHGLRSTFRDWTAERGYPRDMAEISLAHTVGSEVERAYRRSDMLERRRAMMAAWAGFLAGEDTSGEVVAIRGA